MYCLFHIYFSISKIQYWKYLFLHVNFLSSKLIRNKTAFVDSTRSAKAAKKIVCSS